MARPKFSHPPALLIQTVLQAYHNNNTNMPPLCIQQCLPNIPAPSMSKVGETRFYTIKKVCVSVRQIILKWIFAVNCSVRPYWNAFALLILSGVSQQVPVGSSYYNPSSAFPGTAGSIKTSGTVKWQYFVVINPFLDSFYLKKPSVSCACISIETWYLNCWKAHVISFNFG